MSFKKKKKQERHANDHLLAWYWTQRQAGRGRGENREGKHSVSVLQFHGRTGSIIAAYPSNKESCGMHHNQLTTAVLVSLKPNIAVLQEGLSPPYPTGTVKLGVYACGHSVCKSNPWCLRKTPERIQILPDGHHIVCPCRSPLPSSELLVSIGTSIKLSQGSSFRSAAAKMKQAFAKDTCQTSRPPQILFPQT